MTWNKMLNRLAFLLLQLTHLAKKIRRSYYDLRNLLRQIREVWYYHLSVFYQMTGTRYA